jgi:hypothetical protein
MPDKTKINVREQGKDFLEEVPVIYRNGHIVVHKTLWSISKPKGYSVTNEPCGFAYRHGFMTKLGAKTFANYIASVPELFNIKVPEDAKKIGPEIVTAMKEKYEQIIDEENT